MNGLFLMHAALLLVHAHYLVLFNRFFSVSALSRLSFLYLLQQLTTGHLPDANSIKLLSCKVEPLRYRCSRLQELRYPHVDVATLASNTIRHCVQLPVSPT
jgi:hypothetical protein